MSHPALAFCVHWLSRALGVALVVSLITFFMLESLPGDLAFKVAAARYGIEHLSPEVVGDVRTQLGLERGLAERYLHWLTALVTGDFGRSTVSGLSVWESIQGPLGRTLLLVALSWPLMIVCGLGLGAFLGRSPQGFFLAQVLGATISSVPTFVMALLLVLVFSVYMNALPAGGYGGLTYLILPVATLALRGAARIALVTAVSTREAAENPSVEFARIKGLPEREVILYHVLPLAAPPLVAMIFISLAGLFAGVAVVEIVFAYPGIGSLLVDSVTAGDVPVVQGITVVIALLILTSNSIADELVRYFDPRGRRL